MFTTVTVDEPAPGVKAIFSFVAPDQKSGKVRTSRSILIAFFDFLLLSQRELQCHRTEFKVFVTCDDRWSFNIYMSTLESAQASGLLPNRLSTSLVWPGITRPPLAQTFLSTLLLGISPN